MRRSDFPDISELIRIGVDFCRLPPKDDHFHAVQLVCSSALEHFRGIVDLVKDENPIAAKALSRVLLETLVTALVLARHPEKLQDFKDYGRYLHLRYLQTTDGVILRELDHHRLRLIAKHGTDYAQLAQKFRRKLWHGLTRRDSFVEAGFEPSLYDDFYRPTSEFAHGEPSRYVMRDHNDEWVFGRSDKKEGRYLIGSLASSTCLVLQAWEALNETLGLTYGGRLTAFKQPFFSFALKYRDAFLKEVPASYFQP